MRYLKERYLMPVFAAVLCAAAFAVSATGAASAADSRRHAPAPAEEGAQHRHTLKQAEQGSQVAISGVVTQVMAPDKKLTLDYGGGTVLVETGGVEQFARDPVGFDGHQVTVVGAVDDDVFQKKRIKATEVRVGGLDPRHASNNRDEQGGFYEHPLSSGPSEGGRISLEGTVTEIERGQFMLDIGPEDVQVDVDSMKDNPLDDLGATGIEIGDRVSIRGRLENDMFERREVKAEDVAVLRRSDARKGRTGAETPAKNAPY